jgi:hypothetical protein
MVEPGQPVHDLLAGIAAPRILEEGMGGQHRRRKRRETASGQSRDQAPSLRLLGSGRSAGTTRRAGAGVRAAAGLPARPADVSRRPDASEHVPRAIAPSLSQARRPAQSGTGGKPGRPSPRLTLRHPLAHGANTRFSLCLPSSALCQRQGIARRFSRQMTGFCANLPRQAPGSPCPLHKARPPSAGRTGNPPRSNHALQVDLRPSIAALPKEHP